MKHAKALVLSLGALLCAAATAHSSLTSSTPAAGAELGSAPQQFELTFSSRVRLTSMELHADGDERDVKPLPKRFKKAFSLPAEPLEPGHYRLKWRAMSVDSHILSGEIPFEVKAPTGP